MKIWLAWRGVLPGWNRLCVHQRISAVVWGANLPLRSRAGGLRITDWPVATFSMIHTTYLPRHV